MAQTRDYMLPVRRREFLVTILRDDTMIKVERPVTVLRTWGYDEWDENWRVLCPCGQEHLRRDGKFPTLVPVYEESGYCHICRDYHGPDEFVDYYQCYVCGEAIKPGKIYHGPSTVTVPGVYDARREGWMTVTWQTADELDKKGLVTQVKFSSMPQGHCEVYIYQPLTLEEASRMMTGGVSWKSTI